MRRRNKQSYTDLKLRFMFLFIYLVLRSARICLGKLALRSAIFLGSYNIVFIDGKHVKDQESQCIMGWKC
jgi:hypothetical protein